MKSKLASIFSLNCPACRTGDLFPNKSLFFDFSFKMHTRCLHCNESFVREPGFYYGAMFISYIFSAFFSLLFAGILIIGLKIDWHYALFLLTLVLILSFAYLFKVSRSIWIHLFVPFKHKPSKAKEEVLE
ncbi:MAG: DUF983 domain-containing protein [Saprospiraceae bacterium]|nr:DUF983 domain-containing protein [Saprospiraceae bacterium]MBK9221902.1 DUF983 domain-containing protein [Saprospiraceae bacterium]MBK9721157.1 DUF983 domain-containing protein [Saprospiraceae bacterium]MBK9728157.1 DUF983 domain-containing protein [Saprospiraceae bacterium]